MRSEPRGIGTSTEHTAYLRLKSGIPAPQSGSIELNGKTVADLVLERQTDLTDVFFVNRRTIPWPPEPLRNLTIKAILGYMHWEDRRFDKS